MIEKEIRLSEVSHDLWKIQDTNNAAVQMNQNSNHSDMQKVFNMNAHQTKQQYNQGMFGLAPHLLPNFGS